MKKKIVKRFLAQVMALTIAFSGTMAASADTLSGSGDNSNDNGANYQYEILTDADGNVIDLGGMTITIRDWWTENGIQEDYDLNDPYDSQRWDYLQWCEETYNFELERVAISDWGSAPKDFRNYVGKGGDENNYIFVLRSDDVVIDTMYDAGMYDLATLDCLDFSEEKYGHTKVHEQWRVGDKIFGMNAEYSEPRGGLFFNKTLLSGANIDPDSIYNMQEQGTWTWEAWTTIMEQVQDAYRDDTGATTVAGVDANRSLLLLSAIYSNDATPVNLENGAYSFGLEKKNAVTAVEWAQSVLDEYGRVRGEEEQWDGYKDAYINSKYVFLVEDAYVASYDLGDWGCVFNADDEYGYVMFPKGPDATDYVNCWSNNLCAIPACYDADRAWKIAFAYNLYTDPVPGTTEPIDVSIYADKFVDERALTETLPMMMEKGIVNQADMISNLNIGANFTWRFYPGAEYESLTDGYDTMKDAIDATNRKQLSDKINITPSEEEPEDPDDPDDPSENDFYFNPDQMVIRTDENGNTIDLGGAEIIIRDWYSSGEVWPSNDYEKALLEYWEWCQKTYNFTIKQVAISSWADAIADFDKYVSAGGDDKYYAFVLMEEGYNKNVVDSLFNGYMYDLSTLDCIDFTDSQYMANRVHEKYTVQDGIYAMKAGISEPRTGMYFNKGLLREAGIDPDSIYEMQQDGTWDWDAWTSIMNQVQERSMDDNGGITVHGFDSNYSAFVNAAIYSNDGALIGLDEDGYYTLELNSNATGVATKWAYNVINGYSYRIEGSTWDVYKQNFLEGKCAFLVEDAYACTSGNYLTDADFDIGFVMMPMGPNASDYVNCWTNNIVVIPSCYDAEKAWKVAFAYDLYAAPLPGFEDYIDLRPYIISGCIDRTAVNETIPMMMEKGVISYKSMVPDAGNIITQEYIWSIVYGADSEDIASNYSRVVTEAAAVLREANERKVAAAPVAFAEGNFGERSGLTWNYRAANKTLTISGNGQADRGGMIAELPYDIEYVKFEKCTINNSMHEFFDGCSLLKEVDFSGLTLNNVTELGGLFSNCSAIKTVDLSGFSLSNATNAINIFYQCGALEYIVVPKSITTTDDTHVCLNEYYVTMDGQYRNRLTPDIAGQTICNQNVLCPAYDSYGMTIQEDGRLGMRVRFILPNTMLKEREVYTVSTELDDEQYIAFDVTDASVYEKKDFVTTIEIVQYIDVVDMDKMCSFSLTNNQGETILDMSFTAQGYLQDLYYGPTNEYRDMVCALINYGTAAQEYFDVEPVESPINDWLEEYERWYPEIPASQLKAYKPTDTWTSNELTYVGSSLVINDGIVLRHYFMPEEGKSSRDYSFGDNYVMQKNGMICVETDSCALWDLYATKKVSVNTADGQTVDELDYSIGNYIYYAFNAAEPNEELCNFLSAMYNAGNELYKVAKIN